MIGDAVLNWPEQFLYRALTSRLGSPFGLWLNLRVPPQIPRSSVVPPAPQTGAAAGAGCWCWPCSRSRRGFGGGTSIPPNRPVPSRRPPVKAPRAQPFIVANRSRRRIFRARCATCLKRRWRWRAGRFRRVPLTPRSARKRGGRFPFFRKPKICRRPACSTRTPRARLTLDCAAADDLCGHDRTTSRDCSRSAKRGSPNRSNRRWNTKPNSNSSRKKAIRIPN